MYGRRDLGLFSLSAGRVAGRAVPPAVPGVRPKHGPVYWAVPARDRLPLGRAGLVLGQKMRPSCWAHGLVLHAQI